MYSVDGKCEQETKNEREEYYKKDIMNTQQTDNKTQIREDKHCEKVGMKWLQISKSGLSILIVSLLAVTAIIVNIQNIDPVSVDRDITESNTFGTPPIQQTMREKDGDQISKKGKLKQTVETKTDSGEYQRTTDYIYDECGNLVREETVVQEHDSSIKSTTDYEYYSNGILKMKRVISPAIDSEGCFFEGHYDKHGHLMDGQRYNGDSPYPGVDLYGDREDVEIKKQFDINGNLVQFGAYTYEYDTQENIIRVTNSAAIDDCEQEANFFYYSDGSYTITWKDASFKETELYNSDGSLVRVEFLENGSPRQYPFGIENKYDKDGQILSSVRLSSGKQIEKFEYRYTKSKGRTDKIEIYHFSEGDSDGVLTESIKNVYNANGVLIRKIHTEIIAPDRVQSKEMLYIYD